MENELKSKRKMPTRSKTQKIPVEPYSESYFKQAFGADKEEIDDDG